MDRGVDVERSNVVTSPFAGPAMERIPTMVTPGRSYGWRRIVGRGKPAHLGRGEHRWGCRRRYLSGTDPVVRHISGTGIWLDSWVDVVVHTEEVGRIIFSFELREPVVIQAIGVTHPLLSLIAIEVIDVDAGWGKRSHCLVQIF